MVHWVWTWKTLGLTFFGVINYVQKNSSNTVKFNFPKSDIVWCEKVKVNVVKIVSCEKPSVNVVK